MWHSLTDATVAVKRFARGVVVQFEKSYFSGFRITPVKAPTARQSTTTSGPQMNQKSIDHIANFMRHSKVLGSDI
jgi:hypothetical protein